MTIEEMHIAVNLGVQKIASFQVDNLLPQEIDHELNNAMDRFIKQRYIPMGNKYRRGFEQSQKRIDDLRNLVVDHRIRTEFGGNSISGFTFDRARFPNDYMFLISVMSEMYYACPAYAPQIEENTKYYFTLDVTPPTEDINQFIGLYLLDDEGNIDASIIPEAGNLLYTNKMLLDSSIYLQNYSPEQSEFETSNVESVHTSPAITGNNLVICSNTLIEYGLAIKWSNETITKTEGTSTEIAVKNRKENTASDISKRESCSYSQHDDLMTLLSDPFNTTKNTKPLYTIQENFVDIYADNTFFSKFVELKYIRRPKRMNKELSLGCELPDHTHQEIVEMGVKSILEAISDPQYNTQSREVLESE